MVFQGLSALSALASLHDMPTRSLSPALAPTTAPSFTVSVLPLLHLALALVLLGLALLGDLPASVALGTVKSTNATGASPGVMRWSRMDSDIPRLMVSRTLSAGGEARCRALEMLETRARRRRLSTLWSRSTLTPPSKGAACLGAAEMGQATMRELALGLRSAEASLAATRGRSSGGGTGNWKMLLNGNSYFGGRRYSGRLPELSEQRDMIRSTV
jgi:hypothetical protein